MEKWVQNHPPLKLRAIHTGGDIFVHLAAVWLEKEARHVSKEDRERTKHVVYALMYGAGKLRLAEILSVTVEQVQCYRNQSRFILNPDPVLRFCLNGGGGGGSGGFFAPQ